MIGEPAGSMASLLRTSLGRYRYDIQMTGRCKGFFRIASDRSHPTGHRDREAIRTGESVWVSDGLQRGADGGQEQPEVSPQFGHL